MPLYKYSAASLSGGKQHGKVEAANEAQLRVILSEQSLFMLSAEPVSKADTRTKLKIPEVADFCRQLSAMLSSGVVLIRAMMIISQRDMKPSIRKVYKEVISDLQRGSALSEAMSHRGRAFPELLISMMRAGESSGRMDQTAAKMADNYDKQHRIDSKVKSAMIYPIILLVLIVAVVLGLFTFVLPQFFTMFEDMVLPLPTRVMVAISGFLTSNGLLLILIVFLAVLLILYIFRRPGPRRAWDRFKLRVPKVGKLLRTIYTARFARTMASLYVSGIPMIQSLQIARNTVGNTYIDSQFDDVINALGNGRTLSQALSSVDGFDQKLNSTIMIGEESGRLEQMLESVANQFDYDSQVATERLVAMMEPLMIIVMAVVVAFVIISVLLPIFQMYSGVSSMGGGI